MTTQAASASHHTHLHSHTPHEAAVSTTPSSSDISGSSTEEDLLELDFFELQRRLCFQNETEESVAAASAAAAAEGRLTCPRTFDGWACWPETPAGQTAFQHCPYFITGFDPKREGHKQCLEDGSWFRHPETNVTWSNYTTCVDLNDLAWRQNVMRIQETGYLISLCALILSLVIFCSFRSLHCTRVRIHKHLFVSFIINNTLWLIWYGVISFPEVPRNPANAHWCASLHLLVQYFLVANYMWMFCEGFYLHTLIVFAFTRYESKLLLGFYVVGWLGPAIPVALYALFRGLDPDPLETIECWIHPSTYTYFLSVPVCVSLVLSLLFLINILRVLLVKLRNNRRQSMAPTHLHGEHGGESQNAIRKAARATFILIPLLGLHYLLTPLRPEPGTDEEIIYEYITAATLSLQGLCVSLLFCFCNGEVIAALQRRFCPQRNRLKYYNGGDFNHSCAPTTTMSTLILRKQSEIPGAANGGGGTILAGHGHSHSTEDEEVRL